jgi:hypothetical protein
MSAAKRTVTLVVGYLTSFPFLLRVGEYDSHQLAICGLEVAF